MKSCKILVVALTILLTFAFMLSSSRFELAEAADTNLLVNGGFETGTFEGWATTGHVRIDSTTIFNGSYSAYVSDDISHGLNNYITQVVYPTQRLPVGAGLTIEGWIYPLIAGKLPAGPEWPLSAVWLYFYNESSMKADLGIIYTWSMSEVYHNWTYTGIFFMPDFIASNWNFISRDITRDFYAYFGDGDYSGIVLYAVEPKYHYSSASPGPFYVDDLKISAGGEIPPPPVIPQVILDPAATTIPPNNLFTVQAKVENVTDLYSWQLELFYSNSIITAINATEGHFLNASGPTVFLAAIYNDYNATYGRLVLAASFLGENPGVNGGGILTTIVFKAIAVGNSALYARNPGTMLLDSQGKQIIPVGVKNGSISVKWLTDLNGDRKVDIRDIVIVALAYGSYPGHPRWNPVADLNKDSIVDIRDLAMVAKDFGKTL